MPYNARYNINYGAYNNYYKTSYSTTTYAYGVFNWPANLIAPVYYPPGGSYPFTGLSNQAYYYYGQYGNYWTSTDGFNV